MNEVLTDKNYILYAARHYDNVNCLNEEEFEEDLARIKYIKRLFNKYLETGELKEQLVINHLVIFFNMFGHTPAVRLLFLKLSEYYEILKPFLIFLNHCPDKIYNLNKEGTVIFTSDIALDENVVALLREMDRKNA